MKKTKRRHSPFAVRARAAGVAGFLFAATVAHAGGLEISNVSIAPRDGTTSLVTFDIAWPNAYRYGRFHDTAWVFFKVRADVKSDWQPVRLVADTVVNPAGYSSGEGTALEFVVPGGDDGFVGMFVRLARDGRGDVAARNVTGVLDLDAEHRTRNAEIRAFGVEMAYVAGGPFYLGAGSMRRLNSFYEYQAEGSDTPAYRVTGPGAIPTGRQKGRLWALGFLPEDGGEIPAAFPEGYAAFYCVKRPYFNQALYAGFLNTLTPEQAKKRWYVDGQGRQIRRTGTAPDYAYAPSAPENLVPWMSWEDNAIVAAWAGLRPMTELEYEKAIRGPDYPEQGDVGLSFWGVGEVNAGHMYERMVTVATAEGRTFTGTHGRGTLALPADWPSALNRGAAYRGNYFKHRKYSPVAHLGTAGRSADCNMRSDRATEWLNQYGLFAGWRGARTAPADDTIPGTNPARFDPAVVRTLARLGAPVSVGMMPDGMGAPLASLSAAEDLFPVNARCIVPYQAHAPWQGPADLSARVYLACDGEALCVAAEVTDDRHVNTKSSGELWNGDALQFGVVTPEGVHWNLALGLTTRGVIIHQFAGDGDALFGTVDCSVTRDDKASATRYGVRLPLAALGLAPGDKFGFNFMILDGDNDKGMSQYLRLAQGISYPFVTDWYPRFVIGN